MLKRSDETIDIELDQKYVCNDGRERKKLKIPEKERRKKIQIPVYIPSPASEDPYIVHSNLSILTQKRIEKKKEKKSTFSADDTT